jgi:N-acetylglucosamine-6-sulfatase
MMQRLLFISASLIGMLSGTVLGLGTTSAADAAMAQGPCEQITATCQNAGFVQGGVSAGKGLHLDCINPIMQGTIRAHKESKPLPRVNPQLVAACKARNPGFGQRNASPSEADALPKPASAQLPATVGVTPVQAPSTPNRRPNIVFILTDDLSLNLVQYMPHVLKMQKDGVTFANFFVTDSLCCPSRASIFTGRYPHDTGIFRNVGTDGGYLAFRNRGHEQATFASALPAAGYRAALLGKYLNGYIPASHPPAPGWTSWSVAGFGYREFSYSLSQDGKIVRYGNKPTDYLTDVVSGLGVQFIKQAAGTPFFLEVATFAPHAPYTPAPRDAAALPGLRAPRTPAFDAAPDANAAKWLVKHRALSDTDMANIDRDFRMRAQSVLAIDAMIGELQAAVAAIGAEKNTYFIFSSDNGYHMGEHRLMPGKMTAFDTDIHVPLIVTGPGVPAGVTVEEIGENIDLYSTFIELGGAVASGSIDGRSLVPLLHGQKVADWRNAALVEHRGPNRDPTDPDLPASRSGNPTTYDAIRTLTSVYVEYADGEREYHDLVADSYELRNSFSSLSSEEKAVLHATLAAVKNCHDEKSCRDAERPSRSLSLK